jgi:hypothetical protein
MAQVFKRELGQPTQAPTSAETPSPSAYNFDPVTGQPIGQTPTTGRTINLRVDPTVSEKTFVPPPALEVPPADLSASNPTGAAPQQPIYYGPPAPATRKHHGRTMGIVLVVIGAMILAGTLDIAEYVFPILMIGAGLLLLRKK